MPCSMLDGRNSKINIVLDFGNLTFREGNGHVFKKSTLNRIYVLLTASQSGS
jgi:hypothetical protein